jgi:hypothetical protein
MTTTSKPPLYVSLNGTTMRLVGNYYYRDAGQWEVKYKFRKGKYYSVSAIEHIHGIELKPITKKKWQETNAGYIDKTTKAVRSTDERESRVFKNISF